MVYSAATIASRVAGLGSVIAADYAGRQPVLVGVLRGVAPFFADLIRTIPGPLEIDFIAISSYGSGSGTVRIIKDLDSSIEGRDVLLVEDVVDTGLSLRFFLRNLEARRPASLRICTLIDKPAHRLVQRTIDYVGFAVPESYLVGYGLDIDQRYRNLPDLWEIDPA